MNDEVNGQVEQTIATDAKELQALDRARDALSARDGEGAEKALAEALEINPELTAGIELRALIACQKGDFDSGLKDFQRLTELEPSSHTAWLNLGKCQRDSGDSTGAIQSLGRATEINPEQADAWVLLGLAQRDSGLEAEALATLQSTVQRSPRHLSAVSALALQYQSLGQQSEALAQFAAARDLAPTLPHTHYNLGRAQLEAGLLKEAGECFEQALTINHHYHQAKLGLAELAEQRGDADMAINIYRRLTRRVPNLHQAHVAMFRLLAAERRRSEFRNQLEFSQPLFAESDFPAFWQAQLLALQGQTDQALAALQALLDKPDALLDPSALQLEFDRISSL